MVAIVCQYEVIGSGSIRTLSDVERRDARWRISVITLVPFDLEPPNSSWYHVGRGVFLGTREPLSHSSGAQALLKFWSSPIYASYCVCTDRRAVCQRQLSFLY